MMNLIQLLTLRSICNLRQTRTLCVQYYYFQVLDKSLSFCIYEKLIAAMFFRTQSLQNN